MHMKSIEHRCLLHPILWLSIIFYGFLGTMGSLVGLTLGAKFGFGLRIAATTIPVVET
jgi:hypothetical protein